VKNWITFVGEGRSGHTIISAILGSHPHIRITEEQKFISKWCRGWTKEDILKGLFKSNDGGYLGHRPYGYRANMGFSGLRTFTDPLLVIGDKCGWDAVNEVAKRGQSPDILTRFSEFMELPVKVIHTSRHPLDNIASWINSPKYKRAHPDDEFRTNRMIQRYTKFYQAAEKTMEGQDVFHLRNEELISNPSQVIQDMADWLELPHNRPWRRYCAARVFDRPNLRRDEVVWLKNFKEEVLGDRVINRFSTLREYYGRD
jgi:hypothetical protein